MEPTKKNYGIEFIKALASQLVAAITKKLLVGVGGFKLLILKAILNYGGKELIYWINDELRKVERNQEQQKAKEALDKVKNDPASTPEQIGEAYENYFNAGRKP